MDPREAARRTLNAHAVGTLLADGTPTPHGYVIDRRTGLLVATLSHGELVADETVLLIPGEADPRLQLLLEVDPGAEVRPETQDRWLAYHRVREGPLWTALVIVSARQGEAIVDGEELVAPSPLASDEARLCAHANERREGLARIAGVAPGEAICVGVDAYGLHVRSHAGVGRASFSTAAADGDAARERIEAVLGSV